MTQILNFTIFKIPQMAYILDSLSAAGFYVH